MHAAALNVLRTASRPVPGRACKIICGTRHYCPPRRRFSKSAASLQTPDVPSISTNEVSGGSLGASLRDGEPAIEAEEGKEKEDSPEGENIEGFPGQGPEETPDRAEIEQRVKQRPLTRGRSRRHAPAEGLPPIVLPKWFLKDNVAPGNIRRWIVSKDEGTTQDTLRRNNMLELLSVKDDRKYLLPLEVFLEVRATIKAGLVLRPPPVTRNPVVRTHTVLQCPNEGGMYYLDSIVHLIAHEFEADVISLDAQDIAQIIGPYIDENIAWTESKTSVLGYEAQRAAGRLEMYENETPVSDTAEPLEDDSMENHMLGMDRMGSSIKNMARLTKHMRIMNQMRVSNKSSHIQSVMAKPGDRKGIAILDILAGPPESSQQSAQPKDSLWTERKVKAMLEALIGAADLRRANRISEQATHLSRKGERENSKTTPDERQKSDLAGTGKMPLIVQLKDYNEILGTSGGPALIEALQAAIDKRWQEGRDIVLIGTTADDDCDLTKMDILNLQSDVVDGYKRTILVPSPRTEEMDTVLQADEKLRIRQINLRHIEDMARKMLEGTKTIKLNVNLESNLENSVAFAAGLEEAVWTYPRVHRFATTMIGEYAFNSWESPTEALDGVHFKKAHDIISESDSFKIKWGATELKTESEKDGVTEESDDSKMDNKTIKEKIKIARKTCTTHEKRLLSGVIDPADINTTFGDVHAPKETIEALKTLTSLSLVRPDAFSYGVLASNKIPGLLLYGPPGTGKTLLAKAVAKESGAVVLEVSGAEVNAMYVGEGEKNVKAIFSLAKKLSPCVVFIDEADAILATRGASDSRKSHRETINQFLREWDGMNDLSAFIMVATNRPFDLDEAVLRRLPRRLLVDLPTEKDREVILGLHLKDEALDESVSIAQIANKTPFYSGSDLKNVAVAAALACIKEEMETASKDGGNEPYVYPEKRLLFARHFDQALNEISASISDDMSSLTAIRKFDEKYGDRKGRRKKSTSLGFGGTNIPEVDSEAGRVRKLKTLENPV
ncbi:hypothetical protein B0O99DRAFT_692256 [Bisporella sp. PMI_857]|nr:hypothetical protein B0O99DRAFT_692256 [Bisporella sp. PMI_857]